MQRRGGRGGDRRDGRETEGWEGNWERPGMKGLGRSAEDILLSALHVSCIAGKNR